MNSVLLILIVDEREASASTLRAQLREAGYQVIHAVGAREALLLIEKDRPDLIVAVDRAGQDLARSLESGGAVANCPLVLLGDSDSPRRFRWVSRFLPKPVAGAQLLLEIQNLAATPAQRPETD